MTDDLALVRKALPWHRIPKYLREDAFAAGCLGLVQAARRFDGSRASFATYASLRIRGAAADMLRAEMPLGFRRKEYRKPGDVVPKVVAVGVEFGRFE